jgi:hypothetical protein
MAFGEKPADIAFGEKRGLLVLAPLLLIAIVLFLSFHIPGFLKVLLTEAAKRF